MKLVLLIVGITTSLSVRATGVPVEIPANGVRLTGLLYSAKAEKRSAIVMLHGCSGMRSKSGRVVEAYAFWARHFQRLGYSTLLLDSFTARGVSEICTQRQRGIRPDKERTEDARAALDWLSNQPDIDPDRIHLMGWSNGAMTVLHAIKKDPANKQDTLQFRSAVAFYPGCAAVSKTGDYAISVPLLIQSGGADDWTPAAHCEELVARLKEKQASVDLDVYLGAHHGFDRAGLLSRYRPEVRNPNSRTGWGATIAGHPEARAKAIARTTEFIQEQDRQNRVPRETAADTANIRVGFSVQFP